MEIIAIIKVTPNLRGATSVDFFFKRISSPNLQTRYWLPSDFSRLTTSSRIPYLDSIVVFFTLDKFGHAFETNLFRRHETLQNGEKSLEKK